ncbi:HK97-gp10 family putative phage morphogenesis protein [Phaeobacter gallaeciensis]|uniref:HK97-gp10 family putative phage morphogenesis protein n=1 Tax=Phaeobacter gallaeciensis TaxID=60890 RepID=UPI00237F3379|nr:HK97-gp10 family putative phage morphogenesis protein [Phaeobacter gallaeciensis]MDE4096670.1 HK97 gp10 family phage protein [Phaeobacter gallaeciensis]MDE4105481.1 HK97 gp10 family phage protein [Phaeobacter gallaeciensis]MDE4109937.1 HK97 gp10 family phage protein [Phaeobacter gallaeciensis]MDE4114405.1 HK97 gp10 family phage protein [Phaeobacter gallaeciensis]MDE4118872.1 HK97 gp10 family phage protein [Phaeobacter gallaeciensis]
MSEPKSLSEQSRLLGERLKAIPEAVVRDVQPALIKGAEEVAATMRALVPVDEGDLKSSITVTAPGQTTPAYAEGGGKRTAGINQALVTAGNEKVRHGHLQEFGTVKQEAQPFMRPGARLAKPKAQRRINRAIGQAIKKAAQGDT